MDTVIHTASPPTVAILNVRHSSDFTERLDFTDADTFLHTLADVFDTHGLNGVAEATVLDKDDFNLRYRVHKILVGECGIHAVPERYWRLYVTKDLDLMHKIECLHTYEEAEELTNRVTQEASCCEWNAVIAEPLANCLDDDALLTIVNTLYQAIPASFRNIY